MMVTEREMSTAGKLENSDLNDWYGDNELSRNEKAAALVNAWKLMMRWEREAR